MASSNFVDALEKHLYRSARTIEAYADKSTLNSRLRLVTITLLRRRRNKTEKEVRSHVLKQTLGASYPEAVALVQRIKQLRSQRLQQDCAQCTERGCSLLSNSARINTIAPQQRLPPPVRALFFDVALVNAFEGAQAQRIPNLPWAIMIEQAEGVIHQYTEWNSQENSTLAEECGEPDVYNFESI